MKILLIYLLTVYLINITITFSKNFLHAIFRTWLLIARSPSMTVCSERLCNPLATYCWMGLKGWSGHSRRTSTRARRGTTSTTNCSVSGSTGDSRRSETSYSVTSATNPVSGTLSCDSSADGSLMRFLLLPCVITKKILRKRCHLFSFWCNRVSGVCSWFPLLAERHVWGD